MTSVRFICAMALVLVSATASRGQGLALTCDKPVHDEQAALRHAPLGASRPSLHRLTVRWKSGTRAFVDRPPHAEGLSGVHYLYCGYEPTVGLHLIHKQDEATGTGVLLDNTTGELLPAGERVTFSGDRRQYFATAQPDGLDGEEWYVRSRDGALIWRGLSVIAETRPRYPSVVATFDRVRWNREGQLQATLTCVASPTKPAPRSVTLTRTAKGWAWLPTIRCPKASP